MRFNPRPYFSKTTLLAMLLSLAASPALASDSTSGASTAVADFSFGTTALDQAAVGIGRLTERVMNVEKKVEGLTPPAPTAAELQHVQLEQEQHAGFVNQVWMAR
jgi:hypothetical protein